jgi:hypothetical protein
MYAILRDGEYYLCDKTGGKTIPVDSFGNIDLSINPIWQKFNFCHWQKFDDVGLPFVDEDYQDVYYRKCKLSIIYVDNILEVTKLTSEQVEFLTFKKLKYNY